MTTVDLKLDLKNTTFSLNRKDEQNLSFIVSRAFEEYIENKQDEQLSSEIKNSKELDSILNNIKI
jgi:hypothetical protein